MYIMLLVAKRSVRFGIVYLGVLTRPDRGVVYVHRSPVSHGEVFADGSRATDRTPRKIFFGEFEISTVLGTV